jgi:hypothetical protein
MDDEKNLLETGAKAPIHDKEVDDHAKKNVFGKLNNVANLLKVATARMARIDENEARELAELDATEGMSPAQKENGKKFIADKYGEGRNAARKELSPAMWKVLGEADAAVKLLTSAKQLHSNPLNLATIHGAGTEAQARAHSHVDKMLPAQMTAMRLLVESTGDKTLGAALIQKNDTMPRNLRAFESKALAEKLFGAQCEYVNTAIRKAETAFVEKLHALRAFDGVKMTGTQRIETALRHPDAQLPRSNINFKRPGPSPAQKIAYNLDSI